MQRCFWCHGEQGRGDGLSAVGMFPRPRDLVTADYKIRSTPHGQLPTDDDLRRLIERGMPGTPMPGWKGILTEQEIGDLVVYLKSLSPRFETEKPQPMTIPSGPGSVERGEKLYRETKCFLCHGEAGQGDGQITTTLDFQWGLPYRARDLTRGWTFLGGNEPGEIYSRITGGLNGTPMGPYQDLLSETERWDLAHYVASLDTEPEETSEDFVVAAVHINGEIPPWNPDEPAWKQARPITVPLAGQIVLDPPLRWWIPTAGSAKVRALYNDHEIGFLLEWPDPTGPQDGFSDSALLQFATTVGGKPYFLDGDADNPVTIWRWQTGNAGANLACSVCETAPGETPPQLRTGTGSGTLKTHLADFKVDASWRQGRWRAIFRRSLAGEPDFAAGKFVPILISVRDGANGETGEVRAISTWLFATLEQQPSLRPWLSALVYVLGAFLLEIWLLVKLRS